MRTLLQSGELYRDLVENSLDLMCTHDLNGVLLTVNLAAARALGYEPSELVNRNLRELLSPKVRAELDAYLALMSEKGAATGLMQLRTKSGETRIWKYTNTLRTEGVQVPYVRGLAHDVTELLQTQKALRETAERLSTAAEIGRMYAWEWDPATDKVWRSAECAGILGLNDATRPSTAKEYFELVHPDDRARVWSLVNSLTPRDPVYRTVYRRVRPDGVLLWLEESGRATFDQAGKMIQLVGMTADVTERKQTEEKLRASEERLRLAQQAASIGTFEWNTGTGVSIWTPELEVMYGLPPGGFDGTQTAFENLVHPDDRAGVIELVDGALKTGEPTKGEWRVIWPDGSVHWIAGRWQVLMNESGEPLRMVGVNADITERKLVEDKLREYERAVEGSEEMIAIVDREYRYVIANRKFLDYRRTTKEQVIGRLIPELLNKVVFETIVKEKLDECFRGKVVRYEMQHTYPEIGKRDMSISYFPIEGPAGVDRVACILQDVTERKRGERALVESEEKFRRVFQDAATGMAMVSLEHRFLAVNEAFCEFLGYSEKELMGRDVLSVTHPEDQASSSRAMDQLVAGKSGLQRFEKRYLHKNGQVLWGEVSPTVIRDSEGKPEYLVSQIVDITDRKRAAAQRLLSENRFRQFFETMPEYCYMVSPNGEIVDANPAACAAFGYTKDELVGKPLAILYAPECRLKMSELFERWRSEGELRNEEMVIITKQGERRTVLLNVGSVKDSDGNMFHSTSVQVDITDRKRMEEALRESEARFALVANTAPVMIWMSGIDGRPTYFNQTWLDFTGRSLEDELRLGLIPITHPDDYQRCHKIYVEAFDSRRPFRKECRLRRHDAEYRWMLDVGVPRFLANGSFAGYIGSCVDVTDHKLAEEALGSVGGKLIAAQETERTRIARELHDDINQQLAVVVISLDELKLQPPQSLAQLRRRLGEVGNRTIEISSAVQALSHELHSSKLEYLGLVSGMQGFCQEFSDQHKVEVTFSHKQMPDSLPPEISLCLFRILQGALKNALKHSGVKSFDVRLSGTTGGIHLTVRDQGKGFDVEQALTGHGIGLISMRERVRLVNGKISIESKPNCGTTIDVDVPLSAPIGVAPTARSTTSLARVMVVEDFEPFRRMISSLLQDRAEVQVICEVADGLEAVQKARELQPDLILLDIALPRLNGIEAARQISNLVPQSKILFLSQTTSTDVVQEALSTGASGYAVKIDVEAELLTAVNSVLRGDKFISSRLAVHDLTRNA